MYKGSNLPTAKINKCIDLVPASLLIVKLIQDLPCTRMLRVLFDSGATSCLINSSALPIGCQPTILPTPQKTTTAAGDFDTSKSVILKDLFLPAFDRSKRIFQCEARVFDAPCRYDIIVGRDFLSSIGLKMDFESHTMEWDGTKVDMVNGRALNETEYLFGLLQEQEDPFDTDDATNDAYILDAKYENTSPKEVADAQQHLNQKEKQHLEDVLAKYSELFDGKLGLYPHRKVHLELLPNSVPVHSRPYAVPKTHEGAFKKELDHLIEIGVLKRVGPTEWGSPTFIVPKKDGRVRWVSDMRALNKCLKRRIYPLPRIEDIVARRSKYKYMTKIDLTMMYYMLELDDESKELTTIVTPFGKFAYQRLAMGLKLSPDEAQSVIEAILDGLDVEVYIDDVGIFSDSWEEHMEKVAAVLRRLEDNGCKINPLKCEWAVQETDFLGFWMTPDGVKPWKKKIDGILKMDRPKTTTQLRSFLGAVTYYRNMWPRRSHILAPLTRLTGKGQFDWTDDCEKAFQSMKALIAADTLMVYPDINLPYDIYTDASDYQLGAVIMQQGKAVAYWSRKLNDAQLNYTTMEKELLAVVECFKDFRNILLGGRITVHTDHKNLTFRTLNTQKVLRWRMFLEDFAPTFVYCPGKDNVLADCFSRLPRMEKPAPGPNETKGEEVSFEQLKVPDTSADDVFFVSPPPINSSIPAPTEAEVDEEMPCHFDCCRHKVSILDDEELMEALFHLPEIYYQENAPSSLPIFMEAFLNHPAGDNPIKVEVLEEAQLNDAELKLKLRQDSEHYQLRHVQRHKLICHVADPDRFPNHFRIALPPRMMNRVIHWYHIVLGHCGSTRLYQTISTTFHCIGLKTRCDKYKCHNCQVNKTTGPGYGKLPPRQAPLMPWDEVHVDLIGPWTIMFADNKRSVSFMALTCIDPVLNLLEIELLDGSKSSFAVSRKFENSWIARYPRPNRCVFDKGGEFIGHEFQTMLDSHGIKDVPCTAKNPQSNAVCERVHQTIANIIRTTCLLTPPRTKTQAHELVQDAIAQAIYATRVSVSRSLGTSPGNLTFRRDMLMDLPLTADLISIRARRQQLIDYNLQRQNSRRRTFDYQPGQDILIKSDDPRKMDSRGHGPYRIERVYTNGTADIRRRPTFVERLNIRRLIPYFKPTELLDPANRPTTLVENVEQAVPNPRFLNIVDNVETAYHEMEEEATWI